MTGFLLIFWAAPTMSAGHLLLAVAATGYILQAQGATSPRTRRHNTHFRRFGHICVVDPGSAVDWWCWSATDPPPSPDPPR